MTRPPIEKLSRDLRRHAASEQCKPYPRQLMRQAADALEYVRALESLAEARGRAVDAAVAMRARWGKYDLIDDDDSDCMEAFDAALAALPKGEK